MRPPSRTFFPPPSTLPRNLFIISPKSHQPLLKIVQECIQESTPPSLIIRSLFHTPFYLPTPSFLRVFLMKLTSSSLRRNTVSLTGPSELLRQSSLPSFHANVIFPGVLLTERISTREIILTGPFQTRVSLLSLLLEARYVLFLRYTAFSFFVTFFSPSLSRVVRGLFLS